ncbi:AMP-dependent synthetase and ligase [Desulfarculus baarsii DSM 2075]|uniref:AMP-dependent synthetase and ligase n=1 Tax=Desulfarculus baarsii (strain ATCC 33931 / DSM 2075 / LMG 7858 / VKM B-1802 / 2st14) TaxID=644282 RepID=E1QLG9_DESB2|nr:AMP-binding protein [Desulfarculus baarsii]ADK86404.1 AMP-dependent synthetase and ligase [Desulfarculus baarsii DSM 2075]
MADRHIIDKTLGQILEQTAADYPDHDAVVYVDRGFRLTYSQFDAVVDELAKGLMALGVEPGQKVAVWASNVPYWVALQFATAKIGAILLTVNTHYQRAELDYLLKQSETENLVVADRFRDNDFLDIVYELIPELRTQERGHLHSPRFPHLRRVFFLDQEKHRGMYSIPEVLAMSRMVSDERLAAVKAAQKPDDVVNMQYTSGTTGFPKGVMLTHKSIGTNGYWIGKHQNLGPDDRVCLPVPLFHCFGCVLGVMAAVNHGSCMVILEEFDPVMVMSAVEQERCTALYGVPTMFIAALTHRLFDKFDFSSLRTGIMAGSPCPVKTMREVMERMNMREVTICYGLTENSPVMTQTLPDDDVRRRTETVGKAMPGIEVKIVDPESHVELPTGTIGEVCCRGYSVMKGYYNMPEATAQAIDHDGWLHSGDLGVLDADGYLAITGRYKDMIIRGGENIYPLEVEEFIRHIPGVRDVQVVGVPSQKYGEQVGAFIQLAEGADLTAEDVRDLCRGQISRYKIPKYVAMVEAYPLTASGKVQKYKLVEQAAALWPNA